MTEKKESQPLAEGKSFYDVLNSAMNDPDYFVGFEPEGEDWSGWHGFEYDTVPGAWVRKEKAFTICSLQGRETVVRIVESDPEQYHLPFSHEGRQERVGVRYVIDTVNLGPRGMVLFLGQDSQGQSRVMRRQGDSLCLDYLPPFLKDLAQQHGGFSMTEAEMVEEGVDHWAQFLNLVLAKRTVIPEKMNPDEQWVRQALLDQWGDCVSVGERERFRSGELTEEDTLSALAWATEQDLLGYAYADLFVSS